MHYISRFVAGFTIGFVRVWQISLVTLAIVPLIALAGGLYAYVTFGLIAKVRKAYVRAGEIAEEVKLPVNGYVIPLTFDKRTKLSIFCFHVHKSESYELVGIYECMAKVYFYSCMTCYSLWIAGDSQCQNGTSIFGRRKSSEIIQSGSHEHV